MDVLFISVKPEYVKMILDGCKTVELRKSKPKLSSVKYVVIYSTYPQKKVECICTLEGISEMSPDDMWGGYNSQVGISEDIFFNYYNSSKKAVGLRLGDIVKLEKELSLKDIKYHIPNFSPPQTYK